MENAVEFKMLEKPNIKGYTLIEGFPGIGLIGTIAVGYLADKLNARCIGYILSKSFPPMASIHKGKPVLPARIYVDDKHKLVLLFSELVVPSSVVYDISEGILKWAEKNKIKRIISLAGMTARLGMENKKPEVYGIASNDKIAKELVDKNVKLITEGVTTGVSGILMARCRIDRFPAMSLLIESMRGYPDPGAAADLLEKLENFVGFDIKTKDLVEEARQIEAKMKRLLSNVGTSKKQYERAERHSLMYG
ncbi:MAG: proteasome assembly chaperone family protein [Candidatus Diapherotrites archaeon]|nr:proteasome assembly chaperone family protein [Candidatus Diapherotrites archaeon]